MPLADLVAEYQARGLTREEALRAIMRDVGELLPPVEPLPPLRPVLEEFAELQRAIRAAERAGTIRYERSTNERSTRAPFRPPPTPAQVVERVAEAAPQPPGSPPLGSYYGKIAPGGAFESKGWRPPGITPVGFHRGYWTALTGSTLTLYRSREAVNQWDVSTAEKVTRANTEAAAFVQRWPIQAERSVFTGGRR